MAFALFAGPVYVAAAVAALLRRPLSYAVTKKGKLRGGVSLRTFRLHLWWAAGAGALLAASFLRGNDYLVLRVWCGLTMLVGLTPPALAALSHLIGRRRRLTAPAPARASAPVRAIGRAQLPAPRPSTEDASSPHGPQPARLPRRHQRSTVDETTTTGVPGRPKARRRTRASAPVPRPARQRQSQGGEDLS